MMVLYRKKALQSQSANAAKGLFLSSVSHEIRTPMNAIIGISELALREETSPAVSGYLKNIQHAGSNLLSIINDILDFSKIESGRLDIIKQAYNLDYFLSDVINIVRVRLDEKPLRFVVNIDDSLPTSLIGDESRVRQVLLNLLSNAIKYTQEGGLTFSVSGELLGSGIILMKFSVSDTGIGIKECDLNKLFSTFVQLDMEKNRGIEGTGLGLAITHKLCHMMGGNVTVESDYGKGSTFTAVIPQEIFDPTPIEGRVIDEITDGKFSDTRTSDAVSYFAAPDARVLVVDDVPLNLVVAEGLLSLYKMQIDCCENGIKAIELIKKNGYDMVLMDHIMPEMDGMEAVANIRGLGGEYTKLPIIALTANAMTGMKNMFLENGFNDYLSKPIDVVKLDEVVRNWIPESKMTPG
jgi:CheY-like chemotaxis protein